MHKMLLLSNNFPSMRLIGYFYDYKILIRSIYKNSVLGPHEIWLFGVGDVVGIAPLSCCWEREGGEEEERGIATSASTSVDESGCSKSTECPSNPADDLANTKFGKFLFGDKGVPNECCEIEHRFNAAPYASKEDLRRYKNMLSNLLEEDKIVVRVVDGSVLIGGTIKKVNRPSAEILSCFDYPIISMKTFAL